MIVSRKAALLAAPALVTRAYTRDRMATFDAATIDSTGVFLNSELERLDTDLNMPLASFTWARDIELREDVSIADEIASFTNSNFAVSGSINTTGKQWVGKSANSINRVAVDIGKTPQPLHLWALEVGWTLTELASAQKLGRPVDAQQMEALQLKWNMDIDEQVYIGDSSIGVSGLVNSSAVATGNVVNGVSGTATFATKTEDEILTDINGVLNAAWAASAWAVMPDQLRLPPVQFGALVTRKVSSAGNQSLLSYLKDNTLCNQINGKPLNIQPLKWLTGRGAGGTDRMVVYNRDRKNVRFPLVPLQRTPLEYRSMYQMATYFGRLGSVEFRYPETLSYRDGI